MAGSAAEVAAEAPTGHGIAAAVTRGSDMQTALAKVQGPFLAAASGIQTGFKALGLVTCESVLGAAIGGA